MDDELTQRITKLLDYVDQGAEFSVQQAPLVAREIINWGIFSNLLGGTLLLAATAAVLVIIWRATKPLLKGDSESAFAILSIATIGGGIFVSQAIIALYWGGMALIAPRVYVVYVLKDML